MRLRPDQQWMADAFGDLTWDLLALGCLVIVILILRARPRWRAMDEAGHIAAEKKREQLKQTRRI